MAEWKDAKNNPDNKAGNGHWRWFFEIFLKPKQVFSEISKNENRAWLKPLLVLSILILILTLAGGPARLINIQMNMSQMPEDFQYWTEEQQNQYFQGQAEMQGPLFIYIFPLLISLASLWLGWFLLGNILHLMMTFKGSRQSQGYYLDLVAWSAIPFAFRSIVQIIAVSITRQAIDEPGLSGFLSSGESAGLAFLKILLGMLDIYSIGFVLLLWIGAPIVSGLKPGKIWWVTVTALIVFILLAALPSFVVGRLQGLGSVRPYLFF